MPVWTGIISLSNFTNTKQIDMKGTNLGELEELVMLVTAVLYDEAYGVAIQEELLNRCDRETS